MSAPAQGDESVRSPQKKRETLTKGGQSRPDNTRKLINGNGGALKPQKQMVLAGLQLIAKPAQPGKTLIDIEETRLIHIQSQKT